MSDLFSGCVTVKCSGSAGQTHAQVPAGARAAPGCTCRVCLSVPAVSSEWQRCDEGILLQKGLLSVSVQLSQLFILTGYLEAGI